MSDFPSAIHSPRTISNRVGVVYDADNEKTFYAEDLNDANDEIVAIENALGANLSNLALTGWLALATIPTLQSSDDPVYVLRFAANMTGILQNGHRIKITQNGSIRYFIVVSVGAYTGGNTDITCYGGTDYDALNTGTYPITLPCYSSHKAPFGFPMDPTKWRVITTDNSSRNHATSAANTWYNLTNTIVLPIGIWDVQYMVGLASSVAGWHRVTLSTANNSESDSGWSSEVQLSSSSNSIPVFKRNMIIRTSKATYYLNTLTREAGNPTIYNTNDRHFLSIIANCAYL